MKKVSLENLVKSDEIVILSGGQDDFTTYPDRIEYATVWRTQEGEVFAVEPFLLYSDGTRHYYNRIAGEELEREYIDTYGPIEE